MKLHHKIALITGASQGIGKEMALLFADEGATVLACDINALTYEHENVHYYKLNVSDSKEVQSVFEKITNIYPTIDILINNAGITRDGMTKNITDDMWQLVIDVNLKGVFNTTRLIGPFMEKQGFGSIINISSIVGEYGNIGQANYAATKAGVIGMTKTWAKEFARKGLPIRVNAISPGYIMTDILKTVPEDLLKSFAEMTMLKRLGQPIEIAKAALFLASDDASYITGHTLSVNGGMRL